MALSKASVLFFYARIFTTQSRLFRYGLWVGHILNFLWWLTSIARCLLFCVPVDKYWNIQKPGFCRSADALYIGSAVPSVVIDAYVLLLPLPIIARLSMKLGRKTLVIVVFICAYLLEFPLFPPLRSIKAVSDGKIAVSLLSLWVVSSRPSQPDLC